MTTIAGCGSSDSGSEISEASPAVSSSAKPDGPKLNAKPEPSTDLAGIHNLMRVSERFYSGSEPHGEDGFASLAKLGVKTVISVDGAKPDVEAARKHGIRYVHVPIGYDGVPEEAGRSLTRAVREVESPIYVHCHHGKHRGPAAAAVACIASGDMANEDALGILERVGTSKDYKGLWQDVENFVLPAADAKLPELVEIAEVGSFAAAMSQVDRSFDTLKLCRDANWGVPPNQSDLDSAQEALLLPEGLHEAGRNLEEGFDEQFKQWLTRAEAEAMHLQSDIKRNDARAANERLLLLEKSCKQCHHAYRDN
jgi:protein tyrosine phosphatase (PTP) superfamily phosphohydrolase (DUF442 family)